jgi:hypothetical protein
MSADLSAIRHYINESAQEYRGMLNKLDEMKLAIQSIRTSPGHSSSIFLAPHVTNRLAIPSGPTEPSILRGSSHPSEMEDINPITGSVFFGLQKAGVNVVDDLRQGIADNNYHSSPSRLTKSVTINVDNELEQ